MNPGTTYDVAIAGGGLAGLSLSIQCAKAGLKTILIEKETYPFHRVCGEYISLESWDFMESLGIPLSEMNLPVIRKLIVSAPNGKTLEHMLPLGGFGISRYKLDSLMASFAEKKGVTIIQKTKVQDIVFENGVYKLDCNGSLIQSRIAVGTFGKRSNIDNGWQRKFILQKPNKLNNYIGVKYHIRYDFADDTIALHNFNNGYCGISRIEDDKYCLCYLTTADNLKRSGNNIKIMEEKVLSKNPFLKKIFSEATFLYDSPEVISQISFAKKSQVENHVLLIGDAAGMITPLCGNGMSMAMHGSKLAFAVIKKYLSGKLTLQAMEEKYQRNWNKQFKNRFRTGRIIQRFFGSPFLSNLLISAVKPFPKITDRIISATHGKRF